MKKHLNCLAESGRLSGALSHPERAPAPFKRNSTRLILRLRLAFAKCWRFHRVPAKIRFLKCCLWEQFISAGNKPSEHVCMSVWRESSPFYRVLPQGANTLQLAALQVRYPISWQERATSSKRGRSCYFHVKVKQLEGKFVAGDYQRLRNMILAGTL